MKTRIISGIVMAVIVAAVLGLGFCVSRLFITVFVGALAAAAVWEFCHNAAGIKSKAAQIFAMLYAFLNVFILNDYQITVAHYSVTPEVVSIVLSVVYFYVAVVCVLKNHKDFSLAQIVVLCAMPLFISYSFGTLGRIISLGNFRSIIARKNSIYHLLMLLNFSSICDMGAYFAGVTLGKHKLCPEISPKKTVEGAIGGIVASVIFSLVFMYAFGHTEKMLVTLILTVPLCILGMLGDLFASALKRSVGIKDYSNLIPGHGGILDRTDSILMISPALYLLILFGVL